MYIKNNRNDNVCTNMSGVFTFASCRNYRQEKEKEEREGKQMKKRREEKKKKNFSRLPNTFSSLSRYYIQTKQFSPIFKIFLKTRRQYHFLSIDDNNNNNHIDQIFNIKRIVFYLA